MNRLARLAWRWAPCPTYRLSLWRWQWREWNGRCPRWANETHNDRTLWYRDCPNPVGRWRYAAHGHCGQH